MVVGLQVAGCNKQVASSQIPVAGVCMRLCFVLQTDCLAKEKSVTFREHIECCDQY